MIRLKLAPMLPTMPACSQCEIVLSSITQPRLQWVPMSPICSAVGGAHFGAACRRMNPRTVMKLRPGLSG